MAAEMAAAAGMAVLVAGMEGPAIGAALAGTAVVRVGITLALAGMGVVVPGTAVAGTAGVAAGITVVTVAVGELAPRLVWVLALEYSEEHLRPPPIMVAMTTATITRLIPIHPHLRFGIGAMPIRAIILRYRSVLFRGGKLFSKA